jgi:hypothetical protein
MKKIILTFVFASTLTTMSAQTETTQTKDAVKILQQMVC